MRRVLVAVAIGGLLTAVRPAAQETPATGQAFRTGIDVIRLDVSVFDTDRRPVRGLTAADFVVKENGRPQRIVAVTEVDAAAADAPPSPWMRHAPRDVASNDLGDGLADGQAVAIVLDDFSIPDDSVEMAISARETARYIINSLGPSDVAAIVYPFKPGRTQDFTRDRTKLFAAIDRFDPEQPEWLWLQPRYSSPLAGDIQRYNTALSRDPCLQVQPVFPTLRTVTSRLATVPNRRKALFFLSIGVPFQFRPGNSRCQGVLYDEMRRTFETAQRFNVNIHGIDPAGAAGFQRYLQQPRIRNVRLEPGRDLVAARGTAIRRHDFLKLLGEQTGGRAVVDSDDLEASVAEILEEYGTYYLIGYETSNGDPDGKFRRLEVEVPGRDVTIRTKSGRWAPDPNTLVAENGPREVRCVLECWHAQPPASSFHLSGLMPNQLLRMRAALYPLAPAVSAPSGRSSAIDVAAVLTIRLPALVRSSDDTLTLVRTSYDEEGQSSGPVQQTFVRRLDADGGDETAYDIVTRFTLAPGRHHVRFNATSRLADASGSVIAEIDVPDLSRSAPTMSSVVLGAPPPAADVEGTLAPLAPIVPITRRDFARGERIRAFVRLFAAEPSPTAPVPLEVRVLDASDREVLMLPATPVPPEAFGGGPSADYAFDLPLSSLEAGPHLASVTATFAGGRIVRRDVVFRVR